MAEGNGLLNRHRAKSSVAGSNPALSAIFTKTKRGRDLNGDSERGVPLSRGDLSVAKARGGLAPECWYGRWSDDVDEDLSTLLARAL